MLNIEILKFEAQDIITTSCTHWNYSVEFDNAGGHKATCNFCGATGTAYYDPNDQNFTRVEKVIWD